MLKDWIIFVATSSAITITVLGFLIKWLLDLQSKRIIKDYESTLKKELSDHQTRYSILHEKRAEVIGELYGKIARIGIRFEKLIKLLNTDDDFKQLNHEVEELVKNGWDYFNENEIYFDDSISSLITSTFTVFEWVFIHYSISSGDEFSFDKRINDWKEAYNAFTNEWPPLKDRLKAEMKIILEGKVEKL